ncbi:MAG TPA: DNA primase [Coriobacteriia bacterium]|nr:DNA primase [Coriobacteriia bacterium]
MGRISDVDVQRVREATDLVSLISERIVLKPKGRLFWGLCPFHGEKTPSFKVDPGTQLWHCFGCGKGGDAFGFVIESDKVDFPDAVRLLADRANIDIVEESGGAPRGRKERLFAACEEAANYYHKTLTSSRDAGPKTARDYLSKRGFGSEVAKGWRLGYAPGRGVLVRHLTEQGFSADEMVDANLALRTDGGQLRDRFYERIMFPIVDLQGRYIAFGGRVVEKGEPKYLNTNDTPVFRKSANMYGIDRAKASITSTGDAIVVEGYTDVIALHEEGITNAVATLGTALTQQHLKLLGRFARRIIYLFDGDEAGMRAADRAAEFVDVYSTEAHREHRLELNAAVVPDGQDPADFVKARGKQGLVELVGEAVPLLRFSIDRRLARWDLERPEERARALKEAAEVLAPVKDSLLADDYANYIASRLFADFATVRRAISSTRPQPARAEVPEEGGQAETPKRVVQHTPRTRAELELLSLLVAEARLRGRARKLLAMGLLSSAEHQAMAEVLSEAGEAAGASEINGALEKRVPGAIEELAGARFGESSAEADALADGLTRRLKEFELERRIAVGKAALDQGAPATDAMDYNAVFREVSTLQRTLDALRRGEDVPDQELEARN